MLGDLTLGKFTVLQYLKFLYLVQLKFVFKMKINVALLVIFFCVLIGCKNGEVLVNVKESGCKDGIMDSITFKVEGSLYYGEPVSLILDGAPLDPYGPYKYVIETPNGLSTQFSSAHFRRFNPTDEGTYYGYAYMNSCKTKKISYNLKGKPYVLACNPAYSWYNVPGTGAQDVTMKSFTKGVILGRFTVIGVKDTSTRAEIYFNKNNIDVGEFAMFDNISSIPPNAKAIVVNIKVPNSNKLLANYSQDKLYVKDSAGKYILTICNAPFKFSATDTASYPLTLRVVVN